MEKKVEARQGSGSNFFDGPGLARARLLRLYIDPSLTQYYYQIQVLHSESICFFPHSPIEEDGDAQTFLMRSLAKTYLGITTFLVIKRTLVYSQIRDDCNRNII